MRVLKRASPLQVEKTLNRLLEGLDPRGHYPVEMARLATVVLALPYCNGPSMNAPFHHRPEQSAEVCLETAKLVHRHYSAHLIDDLLRDQAEQKAEVHVGIYLDSCLLQNSQVAVSRIQYYLDGLPMDHHGRYRHPLTIQADILHRRGYV